MSLSQPALADSRSKELPSSRTHQCGSEPIGRQTRWPRSKLHLSVGNFPFLVSALRSCSWSLNTIPSFTPAIQNWRSALLCSSEWVNEWPCWSPSRWKSFIARMAPKQDHVTPLKAPQRLRVPVKQRGMGPDLLCHTAGVWPSGLDSHVALGSTHVQFPALDQAPGYHGPRGKVAIAQVHKILLEDPAQS